MEIVEGEVIIKQEKVKRSRKKEKEPKFLPPFYSEDFFRVFTTDSVRNSGAIKYSLFKWKNEEYLPLYSINLKMNLDVPYYDYSYLVSCDSSSFDTILSHTQTGKSLQRYMPNEGIKYFKHLWNTKNYRFLSFFHNGMISSTIENDFETKMKSFVQEYFKCNMESPINLDIVIPNSNYHSGFHKVIDFFKYVNAWKWVQVKKRGVSYNMQPMYLTNLGFIARQSVWNNYESDGVNTKPNLYPIEPLVCLVFKKEYYHLIKAYILANEPIPSELLELWVNKSLDDATINEHNIRPAYIRHIKNYYKKLGINATIKDNLTDELFLKYELKKFRTVGEQINWVDNILQEFTIQERKKYRN